MRLPRWNPLTAVTVKPVLTQLGIGVALLYAVVVLPAASRRGTWYRRGAFEFDKYTWLEWFFLGVALVVIVVSTVQLVPLLRHAMKASGPPDLRELTRASMPRTIYELLLGVAATDGTIDPYERDVVGNVMLHRLPDVVTKQDLKNWSTTIEPPRDPVALARRLVDAMTEHERAALWEWCREVAAVDGTDDDERDVLRQIRAVLKPTNYAAGLRR